MQPRRPPLNPINAQSTAALSGVHIAVTTDPAAARTAWQTLEEAGQSTLYQSWAWCAAWRDTVGRARGITPVVVMGQDAEGRPLFVLPLQLDRRWGTTLLQWQTWPHASYGYGLYAADFLPRAGEWFARHHTDLAQRLPAFDLWALHDMPAELFAMPHPFAALFNLRGANALYAMDIGSDFAALHAAKRSGETRRSTRKRDTRLEAMGRLSFGLPHSAAERQDVLERMFADHRNRMAEANVHGVFDDVGKAFVHALGANDDAGSPLLRPYVLRLDDRILAVKLGAVHGGCFWALISSLAAGPERKYSPGDLALRRMIEACCAEGLESIDFASGDTPYKQHWADRVVPLFSLVRPRTARGAALWLPVAGYYHAKRVAKHTPLLKDLHRSIRGWLPPWR